MTVVRGRLPGSETAPSRGEAVEQLVSNETVIVEHIVSGDVDVPVDYDQDHDEWVAVLDGSADLEVDGHVLSLEPGDWVVLPAHTPHRLVNTARGTRWLAVRFPTSSEM